MTIACYARKSSSISNDSIDHQLDIMKSYLNQKKEFSGANIICFVDDGLSGITVDRPQFQLLLTKVRERLIDVIVVKDLSRLGRNYLDICKLTDSIFPFMGVRLIAISDNYDSNIKQQTLIDLGTAFKAILSEYYVIETSKKIQASNTARIRSGQFLGSLPYGYYRVDRYTVKIDECKAAIVRKIFDLFLQGKTVSQITGILNSENADNKSWNVQTIRKMLNSECYIGKKVALTYKRDVKLKRKLPIDEKDWYVNENAYPPIIEKETFDLARQKTRVTDRSSVCNKDKNIMARKLYCATCGKTLRRNPASFVCKNGYQAGVRPCFEGCFPKERLLSGVLSKVKDYINDCLNEYSFRFSFSDIVNIEHELKKLMETKAKLFEALVDERINEDQFTAENNRISAAISEKKNELECCRKVAVLNSRYKTERLIDILRKLSASSELTKEHMMFVKRINVFDIDHFEVVFQDDNPITVLCKNINIYEEEFL